MSVPLPEEGAWGELLIGDRSGRERFLADYALIDQAPTVPHAEVVQFVSHRRLQGRGIAWVDAHLLAAALIARVSLCTADARLAAITTALRSISNSGT